jgi:hypothetical protein
MVHLATAGPVSNLGPANTIDTRGSLESEEDQTRGDTSINIEINIGEENAMSAKKDKIIF